MWKVRELADKVTNVVMNYTEIEAKVREATNDDSWGPTGSMLQELSTATFTYEQFPEVMGMLWKRMLQDNRKNWRRTYKALVVLAYLLRNGSERVVTSAREHIYDLRTLENYSFVDEQGKDQGINIRHKVKEMIDFIQDDDKLREERKKAKKNKDKYIGMSNDMMGFNRMNWGNEPSRNKDDFDTWDPKRVTSTTGKSNYRDHSPDLSDDGGDKVGSTVRASEFKDSDESPTSSSPTRNGRIKKQSSGESPVRFTPPHHLSSCEFRLPEHRPGSVSPKKPVADLYASDTAGGGDFGDFESAFPSTNELSGAEKDEDFADFASAFSGLRTGEVLNIPSGPLSLPSSYGIPSTGGVGNDLLNLNDGGLGGGPYKGPPAVSNIAAGGLNLFGLSQPTSLPPQIPQMDLLTEFGPSSTTTTLTPDKKAFKLGSARNWFVLDDICDEISAVLRTQPGAIRCSDPDEEWRRNRVEDLLRSFCSFLPGPFTEQKFCDVDSRLSDPDVAVVHAYERVVKILLSNGHAPIWFLVSSGFYRETMEGVVDALVCGQVEPHIGLRVVDELLNHAVSEWILPSCKPDGDAGAIEDLATTIASLPDVVGNVCCDKFPRNYNEDNFANRVGKVLLDGVSVICEACRRCVDCSVRPITILLTKLFRRRGVNCISRKFLPDVLKVVQEDYVARRVMHVVFERLDDRRTFDAIVESVVRVAESQEAVVCLLGRSERVSELLSCKLAFHSYSSDVLVARKIVGYLSKCESRDFVSAFAEKLAVVWGNKSSLNNVCFEQHVFISRLLILATKAGVAEAGNRSILALVTDGVTRHLESTDVLIRQMGMSVAQILCPLVNPDGPKLEFEVPSWSGCRDLHDELVSLCKDHSVVAKGRKEEEEDDDKNKKRKNESVETVGLDSDDDTEEENDDHDDINGRPMLMTSNEILTALGSEDPDVVSNALASVPRTVPKQMASFSEPMKMAALLPLMESVLFSRGHEGFRFDALVTLAKCGPVFAPKFLADKLFSRELGTRERLDVLCILMRAVKDLDQARTVRNVSSASEMDAVVDARVQARTRRFFSTPQVLSSRESTNVVGGFFYPLVEPFFGCSSLPPALQDAFVLGTYIRCLGTILSCAGQSPRFMDMSSAGLQVVHLVKQHPEGAVREACLWLVGIVAAGVAKPFLPDMLDRLAEFVRWISDVQFRDPHGGCRVMAARVGPVLAACFHVASSVHPSLNPSVAPDANSFPSIDMHYWRLLSDRLTEFQAKPGNTWSNVGSVNIDLNLRTGTGASGRNNAPSMNQLMGQAAKMSPKIGEGKAGPVSSL
ncbi:unnamed protein product [Notodromas monacha]|uniref:ENTH domain-containing protein n=1 Tax=Notodromas monacha TaxID=399045 RepID=A0A7R9BTR5_9CRUS|nr:unnamed protein product [Notodromas monacha]CAG0920046.1 unnamed protein product [Notodromas monacha]